MNILSIAQCFEEDGITPKQNCFVLTNSNGEPAYVDAATIIAVLGLDKKIEVRNTSAQIKAAFNLTNYFTAFVGLGGRVNLTAYGTDPRFKFLNPVSIPTKTPSTPTDAGQIGELAWDADYFYVCTAANQWQRIAYDNTWI